MSEDFRLKYSPRESSRPRRDALNAWHAGRSGDGVFQKRRSLGGTERFWDEFPERFPPGGVERFAPLGAVGGYSNADLGVGPEESGAALIGPCTAACKRCPYAPR